MSSLSTILADAERIAGEFVPPNSALGPVVGVLVKHVEALAGKELPVLADDILGVTVPQPTEEEQAVEAQKTELEQLREQVADLQTELNVERVAHQQTASDINAAVTAQLQAQGVAKSTDVAPTTPTTGGEQPA